MSPPSRSFRCAAAALALASAAGCGWFQSALQVHVTVDPLVQATCVQVDLFTSSDTSGEPVDRREIKRPQGKDDFIVGIFRGALPPQVFVTARPMFGVECTDLVPNGALAVGSGTFPPSGFTQVDLSLDAPAVDADGDGFVPPPNGADCNDGNPAVHPGAPEHCSEAADFNCNALIGCADPACSGVPCLASPTQLVFASAPQTLTSGACSAAVRVDTQGASGTVVPVVVPVTVSFTATDGNLILFSDASCTTQASDVVVAAGRSRATLYVKGTTAGPAHLSASAAGLTGAQQTETVVPGAATALVFTTAPQTMAAIGGCSAPVRLELRDAFGNATSVGTPLNIGLTSNAPGSSFKFYPDSSCQNANIVLTPVAAGGTSSTFYFKSTATAEGTVAITATAGSLSAMQSEGLVFRQATQLVFPNLPVTVAQNACSPVALQTQDASGNPAPVLANLSIGLSSSGPALTFYRDVACLNGAATSVTLLAGLSNVTFYFESLQGSPTITANGGALGSPQQTETVTPPQPTQLAFSTAAQTAVTANACSGAVNIDARDASGTPTAVLSPTTVNLATNPSGQVLLYAGAGCTGSAITSTTMATGTSRVTISFKGTVAGSTDITASATGLTSATQTEGVVAAAGTKVVISVGKGQTVAAGACASLTLERQDPFGNATTGALETMALSSVPAAGMAFYGNSGCTSSPITTIQLPAASSRVFVYFKGTASGSYTLTEAPGSTLMGDGAPETVTAGSATELRFTSTAQSGVGAGSCSAAVTVASTDAAGAPSPVTSATSVSLGATGTTNTTLYSDAACSTVITSAVIASGTSSTTYYFKGTAVGSGTLTASATGLTPAPPQTFSIAAGTPTKLAIIQGPFSVTAGVCISTPIAIQVQDVFGNPSPVTPGITVGLAASSADTALPYQLTTNGNCNGSGPLTSIAIGTGGSTTSNLFFRSNGAGTWTITATSAPLTQASQNETVTPDNPAQLAYLTPAQSLSTNACSAQVTVQIRDQYGNPSAPAAPQNITLMGTAGFFSNAACTNSIGSGVITVPANQTNGSFYFKAPGTTGSYTINISGVGSPVDQVETIN
ncbi:MAG TPA: MopE-related protein [Myxococcaceae bacterium]|nr:MopE-related protein [Myxococcaceae bacterium]